jgi:hypothetical protein
MAGPMTDKPEQTPLVADADNRLPLSLAKADDGSIAANVRTVEGYKAMFGAQRLETTSGLMQALVNALGNNNEMYHELAVGLMTELAPRDPMEGMLISQLSATHIAISSFSRQMLNATNSELREGYERSLTRLERTFIAQMAALKRYREKPQSRTQIGNVTVNDGGQAIVGSVAAG